MKQIRITVMKTARYPELIAQYENPLEHACDLREGMSFTADGWQRPEGLCENAWRCIERYVMALACGGENFFDGWMKNPRSAMIACDDGFRPVSFLLEALDGDATGASAAAEK